MDNRKFLEHFTLIRYNSVSCPEGYPAHICEVAGHFDKDAINTAGSYSLHTEYSYGKRKFDSHPVAQFSTLCTSHKNGVPQLWKSCEWAAEFANFIIELTKDCSAPAIVEIHPPFNDYCSLPDFAERYRVFEEQLHKAHPETEIVIENRSGTVYHGGKFLIGKAKEIAALCEIIETQKLRLGVVLDFPQLLTAEYINPTKFKTEKYAAAIGEISPYRSHIKGIHIWGKKKSPKGRWVAHAGNLDTYFDCNSEIKECFLTGIRQICDDDIVRFLVPEVNTGSDDLISIMLDLSKAFY